MDGKFIGDFHIHSHFSLATSKELVPEYLDYWARVKGIKVVGTGDFTHPKWIKELKEKLEPAEQGLYKLKDEYKLNHAIHGFVPEDQDIRFVLTAEISNIYKKNGNVRKVHNILFAPDFEIVEKMQHQLNARNFNITSDGRPILGLDAKDLLDMSLNVSEQIFFVPAHIWTPWFSVLGAKSGFNTIEECFEDLSSHIHAVETGLSSDPPMNRVCSILDKYTLIANSDAHSPEKLGRNANVFETEVSYDHIIEAMKTGNPEHFKGTIDFFPQEGKYHYDGHRKCNIQWDPLKTLEHKGVCPVCGKKVTVGVMHRVAELADRGVPSEKGKNPYFYPLIPLKEILSEILKTGPNTQRVAKEYSRLLNKAGSEFNILLHNSISTIAGYQNDALTEAIDRMRNRNVIIKEGYDGAYGEIHVFDDNESFIPSNQNILFNDNTHIQNKMASRPLISFDLSKFRELKDSGINLVEESSKSNKSLVKGFNAIQKQAVQHEAKPALVLAGPGTGKTRVLTHRIAYLIDNDHAAPDEILALTFTNKAAQEMKERVEELLQNEHYKKKVNISTFHAFGLSVLKEQYSDQFFIIDDQDKRHILSHELNIDNKKIKKAIQDISGLKQQFIVNTEDIQDEAIKQTFIAYQNVLHRYQLYDLDDLLYIPMRLLYENEEMLSHYKRKYKWIMIDEYQDINHLQYKLIRMLMPGNDANLVAIGDPNQSIYGFRGSDVAFINKFQADYPESTLYTLTKSYRCSDRILKASDGIIGRDSSGKEMLEGLQKGIKINIIQHPTDKSEAESVARKIEEMIGGLRFFSMDSNVTDGGGTREIESLSDFAILCRTRAQMPAMEKALADHAIPFQMMGETPFFQKGPVKSLLQLLQGTQYPHNEYLNTTIAQKHEIHETELIELKKQLSNKNVSEALHYLIQRFFNEQKESHVSEFQRLIDLSASFYKDIAGFIDYVTIGIPQDTYDPGSEAVSLMTIHASKGLEFKCVFIIGCEDGLLPYGLYENMQTDKEEEKRLLYVGMTRAEKYLYLTYAQKRFMQGKEYQLPRSPFIDSIEQELIEMTKGEGRKRKKQTDDQQLRLF